MADWQKSLRRSTGEPRFQSKFRNVVKGEIPTKPVRFRTRRVLSAVIEDEAQENFHAEDRVATGKAARKNSRKTSRPSLSDITNEKDVVDNAVVDSEVVAEEDVFEEKGVFGGIKAPRKKDQTFLLAIPSHSTSSRTPSPKRGNGAENLLPEGVVSIDEDDGSEDCYANEAIFYLKRLEEEDGLDCIWKGWKRSEKRKSARALLFDWIIEVVHYFKASQECLYQTVHIIDKYLSSKTVETNQIQLVGLAAILIGTKLEEYFFSDIQQLQVLCKHSFTAQDIVKMEMDILMILEFKSYSPDPMVFINRCLKAALRTGDEDPYLYEASIFFLDSIICCEDYWGLRSSRKAAAAVYAALNLVPDEKGAKSSWTRTLEYYCGHRVDQIALLSRQMLDLLIKAVTMDDAEEECGLRRKYKSRSRHHCFLDTRYCSVENIEDAIYRIMTH